MFLYFILLSMLDTVQSLKVNRKMRSMQGLAAIGAISANVPSCTSTIQSTNKFHPGFLGGSMGGGSYPMQSSFDEESVRIHNTEHLGSSGVARKAWSDVTRVVPSWVEDDEEFLKELNISNDHSDDSCDPEDDSELVEINNLAKKKVRFCSNLVTKVIESGSSSRDSFTQTNFEDLDETCLGGERDVVRIIKARPYREDMDKRVRAGENDEELVGNNNLDVPTPQRKIWFGEWGGDEDPFYSRPVQTIS